jgi:hypothetical protein
LPRDVRKFDSAAGTIDSLRHSADYQRDRRYGRGSKEPAVRCRSGAKLKALAPLSDPNRID